MNSANFTKLARKPAHLPARFVNRLVSTPGKRLHPRMHRHLYDLFAKYHQQEVGSILVNVQHRKTVTALG